MRRGGGVGGGKKMKKKSDDGKTDGATGEQKTPKIYQLNPKGKAQAGASVLLTLGFYFLEPRDGFRKDFRQCHRR